jgi:hypothetical protein
VEHKLGALQHLLQISQKLKIPQQEFSVFWIENPPMLIHMPPKVKLKIEKKVIDYNL